MQEFDIVQFKDGNRSKYMVNHETCVVLEIDNGKLWGSSILAFEIRDLIERGRMDVVGKGHVELNIQEVE